MPQPDASPADGPAGGIPPGYHAVTPWIISRDTARLIEFTKRAFGAAELGRVAGRAGGIGHAEVRIGDSVVMMFDTREGWPDTPAFLRLYVADGDAVYQRALQAGATSVTAMTSLFFGDRVGRVRDPLGNIWWIQARVDDVDPAEVARRSADQAATGPLRYVEDSLADAMREGTSAGRWQGAVIAEGLRDPALVNDLRVTRAMITGEGLPLDEAGTEGRWHLYWVDVSGDEIDRIQAATLHAWYAHFWQGERLLVVYDDARFDLHRHDQSTWSPAVDHGLGQGLRREWLDFPTDDSAGTLP
jgi:PhnB protein